MLNSVYALALGVTGGLAASDDWHFVWPSNTHECQEVGITITGGVPPWDVDILPIGGQPIYWSVSDPKRPVNSSYPWDATIPLQLSAGTAYTVVVSDADGFNTALDNPTPVQVVQSSNDSSCLKVASPARKDFDFQVYGDAKACQRDFGVAWTTAIPAWPYWCTVVPLDGTYNPWIVTLASATSTATSADWRVNMTSGTRFTVVMHDAYGQGRGGVGQIFEVESSGDNSCTSQQWMGRADWPAGLQVNTIPATSTAWGSIPSNTSAVTASDTQTASGTSAPSTSSSSISSGAIAGIAVGAAAGALALAAALFFLIRRRRRRQPVVTPSMDLLDDHTANVEPKVVPYRPVDQQGDIPSTGYAGYDSDQMSPPSHPWSASVTADSPRSSTTFLSLGAASAGDSSNRATSQYTTSANALSPTSASSNVHMYPGQSVSAPSSSGQSYPTDVKSAFSPTQSSAPTAENGVAGANRAAEPSPSQGSIGNQDNLGNARAPSPEYRRHVDGGRVTSGDNGTVPERQFVDLPPLYSDVPRGEAGEGHGDRGYERQQAPAANDPNDREERRD